MEGPGGGCSAGQRTEPSDGLRPGVVEEVSAGRASSQAWSGQERIENERGLGPGQLQGSVA